MTKECRDCGVLKPWGEFHAAAKWPDGTMRWPASYCKACAGERARRWHERNREWRRAYDRARYRERRADPEWVALRRDQDREGKRRRRGHRPRAAPAILTHSSGETVVAAPFSGWLRHIMDRDGIGTTELADRLGLADNLRTYLQGKRRRVTVTVVDAALVAEGTTTLMDLYPELYEASAQ